jgi:putative phage-type endonuclease
MIEQGSPEWHAMRIGKATASRISDILAKTKSGPSAMRANYLAQLVAERLTGVPATRYKSDAMEWGNEWEVGARSAYEFYHGADVVLVDFIDHPVIDKTGASPDGLVGADGLVEIKCPNTATHIATLFDAKVPDKYVVQMLWQMECTGRQWCDFVSFDPRMPEDMRLFVKRIERDEDRLREIRGEVIKFLEDVNETVEKLVLKYRVPALNAAE